MPVAFHVVARQGGLLRPVAGGKTDHIGEAVFSFAFLALDVMAAFTSMLTRGLFETLPAPALRRARGGLELDHRLARPAWITSSR